MLNCEPSNLQLDGEWFISDFSFIHAADIHLDSPLRGLSNYEGVPADAVRTATRDALNNLIDKAIEEQVAFLIIAGDLYDGDWDDFGTGLFFCAAMGRLERSGIEVYLLFGNHDAVSQITKRLPLPPNVKVFDHKRPQTFEHGPTRVLLHGQSYGERDPGRSLAAGYPPSEPGHLNIGVLHTALTGDPEHSSYSPCTPAELSAKGYDYWALGHVHGFAVVQREPFIVFPGNLQGRHVRETGPKGAALVSVYDGSVRDVEHIVLDAVRWAQINVDVAGADDPVDVDHRLRNELSNACREVADGRALVARVRLTGATRLHPILARKGPALREEVRAIAAAASDNFWIEKVQLATFSTPAATSQLEGGDELGALLAVAPEDEELLQLLRTDFTELSARLPADVGQDSELLSRVRAGDLNQVVIDAVGTLKVRLAERGV